MEELTRYTDAYTALSLDIPKQLDAPTLNQLLIQCAPSLVTTDVRHLPNDFDPKNISATYPLSMTWRWTWLQRVLQTAPAPGVVVRLPLFFQLEPLVFHACRESKTFLFLNDKANMPVARAALSEEAFSTVLTTEDDVTGLITYLTQQGFSKPLHWITISPLAPLRKIDLGSHRMMRSLHLVPGLPIFEECEDSPDNFHLASPLTAESENGHWHISGYLDNPLPLWRFHLPFSPECCKCSCGRAGYKLPYA